MKYRFAVFSCMNMQKSHRQAEFYLKKQNKSGCFSEQGLILPRKYGIL